MTNNYRKQAGISSMLGMPTMSQEANAMKHSRDMMNVGGMFHQALPMSQEVGCNMWLTGENIAMTPTSIIGGKDPATACMELWRNSASHYQNMKSTSADTVAYGYASSNGKIWCTQTFGTFIGTPGKGGGCAIMGRGSSSPRRPKKKPSHKPKRKPKSKPTRSTPNSRLGYQFTIKKRGYRLKSAWVLPAGSIMTSLWAYDARKLRITVSGMKGMSKVRVYLNGKSKGGFSLFKGRTKSYVKKIPSTRRKCVVRIENTGKNPVIVRRAALTRS